MKRIVLFGFLSIFAVQTHADVKEVITDTTKSFISFGKDLLKGVNDGVDEGRKSSEGVDGAVTITNIDEMEKHINIQVLNVTKTNNNLSTTVEVGFKNFSDKPVRIANMDDKDIVLLIDNDGYSTGMSIHNRLNAEFTVPPNTGKKHSFVFNVDKSKAASVRLWSKEFSLIK